MATWLERRRARMALHAKREKARQEREAQEAEHLAAIMEATALKEFGATYAKPFSDGGHCTVDRSAEHAEQLRVQTVIKRDKVDRAEEQDRKLAEMKLADGVFVNLADTVVPPTPEWLDKHETRTFTPKQPDQTARVIRTVRRVSTPVVTKLWMGGKITPTQAAACFRYRDDWDHASLEGRYASSQYSLTASIRGSARGGTSITEDEQMARNRVSWARNAVDALLLTLLDAVVLEDLPLRRASAYVRCRHGQELRHFRRSAEQLAKHYEGVGVDLSQSPISSDA